MTTELAGKDLATILAALRYYEENVQGDSSVLDSAGIADLCGRLNTGKAMLGACGLLLGAYEGQDGGGEAISLVELDEAWKIAREALAKEIRGGR